MYKFVVILALLGTLCSSVFGDIAFTGNVSLSGKSGDWQYRRTTLGWLGGIGTGALGWFTSAEVNRAGRSLSGDLIIGGIKGGGGSFPSSYLAYYTANITLNNVNQNIFSLDSTGTSNFVASAYLAIVEKDVNGNVVVSWDLSEGLFAGVTWSLKDKKTDGPLKYGTFTANKGAYSVSFTVIVSDVTGVVSLAGAVVTPKVLETIVEIDAWPYQASTNTLTLVTVAATGSGSADRNLLVSGSGTNQVYFQVNNSVIVDGSTKSVTIVSSAVATDDLKDGDLKALINAKFSGSASVHVYNITFPAGAASITYDPTLGSGATVESQQGAASATSISFFLVAIFAIVAALL